MSDNQPTGPKALPPLATRALEELLCNPDQVGDLESVYTRKSDSWSFELPSLEGLVGFNGEPRKLKICIATEDIVGPVRNGGIGTTYAALARMLAAEGHETSVLYLRGTSVENESVEHWIAEYAKSGVRFIPVPDYASSANALSSAPVWMRPMYNMYRWLLDHPQDVVHVSEWRGSSFMSLLAKRQGLAFSKTLFAVKTSSPWLWNRLYGSQAIERLDDLTKTYAERKSVELADMVIGGSLHLLRWMASQGYDVPKERSYVQPNVVVFDHLKPLMAKRQLSPGSRLPIDELVFFGRLESRKGLVTFAQAIRRLIKLGHKLPPKISFMGKEGARLEVRSRQTVREFIETETKDWPCKIQILTDFQQYEALNYLLSGNRLAVMPSTIENSSLAVYEAAICHIPFVASYTGGTPELIAPHDHDIVLCDPHPIPLADRMADAISKGGHIATPNFDNDKNLQIWKDFHKALGRGGLEHLLAISEQQTAVAAPAAAARIEALIYSRGALDKLTVSINAMLEQTRRPDLVRVALDSMVTAAEVQKAVHALTKGALAFEIVDSFNYDMGLAFNRLVDSSTADFLFFIEEGAGLAPSALATLQSVAHRRQADVLSFFFEISDVDAPGNGDTAIDLIGNPSGTFYQVQNAPIPLLVRREAFTRLGGFSTDYRVTLHDREFVAKAVVSGARCETVPALLGSVLQYEEPWLEDELYDQQAASFRVLRPYLAAVPLALRELLLASKGMQVALGRKPAAGKRAPAGKNGQGKQNGNGRVADLLSLIDAADDFPATAARPAKPVAKPVRATPAVVVKPAVVLNGRAQNVQSILDAAASQTLLSAEDFAGAGGMLSEELFRPTIGGVQRKNVDKQAKLVGPGLVLDIRHGQAFGWVRPTSDSGPVVVIARSGRKTIAEMPAMLPLRGAEAVVEKLGPCGFRLPLFSTLQSLRLSAKPIKVDVLTKNGVMLASNLTVFPPRATLKEAGFQGHCDPVIADTLHGWVWNPATPRERYDVSIYIDGRFTSRLMANTFREDLKAAGIGDGFHAYALPLPRSIFDGKPHRIEVQIAMTGMLLSKTPTIFKSPQLRHAAGT